MEHDLVRSKMYDDIPPDRKDYIHLILGCEPTLDLTFDPSRVPLPNDFMKKMDEYYQKQVRKGVVKVKKETVKQGSRYTSQKLPKVKDKKYSWIPVSEIHTARTKIDSFVHLKADERRKLHEKFARLVSSLISQFDHIGTLDDDSITPEQSAHLTAAFLEALAEIENQLFQPITRQHVLAKRGPLFKEKTTFEGRRIKYRNKQTLSDISDNLRKKSNQLEINKNASQDLLVPAGIEEEMDALLPPAYRPSQIPDPPKINRQSFLEMTAKIKAEMGRVEEEHKNRPKPASVLSKPKKKIDILVTPRRQEPPPIVKKKKIVRKKRKGELTFEHVEQPENVFFDKGKYELEPIAGVETGGNLEGIESIFSPMRPRPREQHVEDKPPVDPLVLPEFEKKKHEVEETKYIFKPDLEKVAELRDVEDLFEIDEHGTTEEHQSLVHLWDELGLHPDTRLLMAARLCTIVTEDYSSDYHFQAILGATKDFKTYNKCYKKYKDALNYEPGIASEEKSAILAELSRNFKVAEDAFKLANQEMVHVLGAEIHTNKGPIAAIIESRAEKIRNLRMRSGIITTTQRRKTEES